MTDDEMAEFRVLKLANEHGKFALEIASSVKIDQNALERLQLRGWIRLIDVSPIAAYPGRLFRIFAASSEAMTWFNSRG